MYVNVHFIDLSSSIYVERSLWKKTETLRFMLDFTAKDWKYDKIRVNGSPITEQDLDRKLHTFNTTKSILGEYELQIEKHR